MNDPRTTKIRELEYLNEQLRRDVVALAIALVWPTATEAQRLRAIGIANRKLWIEAKQLKLKAVA